MKKFVIYLLAGVLLASSCASHKRVAENGAASLSVTDGSSFDKAILIKETHERPGIDAEYAWIRTQYPGSKVKGQSLMNHGGKPYDVIHITTADGTDKDVYFDISNFYGKF